MPRRLLALLLAATLFAAACGGDDGDSSAVDTDDDTDEPTDADDEGGDDTATPVDDDDSDEPAADDTDEPAEDDTSEPIELTDSFRGVTATEIHIGVGLVDATDFGFDRGDVPAKWQAVIDEVNGEGGVLGRMIVPHFESYLPIGSTEADAACARLVEDREVFAFVGEARENNELCYTELNETLAVNVFPILSEAIERSDGLLFSTQSSPATDQANAVTAFAEDGHIDGATVHVHAPRGEESLIDPTVAAIEANGGTISASTSTTTDPGDVTTEEAEMDIVVQRALADGADAIFAITAAGGPIAGAVERAGGGLTVLTGAAAPDNYLNFGYDPGAIDLVAVGGESNEDAFARGDEDLLECVDRFEASGDEKINIGGEDGPDNLAATARACKAIDLFVILATTAGADLTNDSFREAAAGIGDFELFGTSAASLGPDKFSADDSPGRIVLWDAATQSFVPK